MRIWLFAVLLFTASVASGQRSIDDSLHQLAVQYLYSSDYTNAMQLLKQASAANAKNVAVHNDIAMIHFLKNEFEEGYDYIRPIAQSDVATDRTYQIAAMLLRGGKKTREADVAYKVALKTFPNSGVLLADYGDFLQQVNPESTAPMTLWERGIASDPNFSGNYFFAAIRYANENKLIRAILFAETFLNLESFTDRSLEMKEHLFALYQRFYALGAPASMAQNDFEKRVAELLGTYKPLVGNGINTDNITAVRSRFILDWFARGLQQQYPSALFEMQRQYLRSGIFEAYNQWIFTRVYNQAQFQNWTKMHPEEYVQFNSTKREQPFIMPAGQYYAVQPQQ